MAGIEKTEAFKCMECDTTHEHINYAITCCGLQITVRGKMTITFEANIHPRNIHDYKSIVEETVEWTDYADGDIIWNNADGEIEDIEFDIDEVDAPEVEE
jgi:hypothetical protein